MRSERASWLNRESISKTETKGKLSKVQLVSNKFHYIGSAARLSSWLCSRGIARAELLRPEASLYAAFQLINNRDMKILRSAVRWFDGGRRKDELYIKSNMFGERLKIFNMHLGSSLEFYVTLFQMIHKKFAIQNSRSQENFTYLSTISHSHQFYFITIRSVLTSVETK